MQGVEVPDGSAGELEVRGPERLPRVLAAARTRRAQAFRGDWFRTGDLAVARGRLVPAARPHQRRHHQDRRLQGVGARDRRGAAHAPVHCRMRRRRGRRRRSGVSGCRRRSNCATARRCRSRICKAGRSRGSRRTRFPRDLRPLAALAAQRHGEGHETRGCRAVQITLTSRMPPRRVRLLLATLVAGAVMIAGDRCGRRPAVLPRGRLRGAVRPGADAGQRIRHLPAGLHAGAAGAVRHRLGDGLSVRRDQPLDALLRADADPDQPRHRRLAELLRRARHRRSALQLSGDRSPRTPARSASPKRRPTRLRQYFLKGGFLWADDFWGSARVGELGVPDRPRAAARGISDRRHPARRSDAAAASSSCTRFRRSRTSSSGGSGAGPTRPSAATTAPRCTSARSAIRIAASWC